MKFGKNLCRVVDAADPEWAPFWLNYKVLKENLKSMSSSKDETTDFETRVEDKGEKDEKEPKMKDVSTNRESEVFFFGLVRAELRKCAEFYKSAVEQLRVRSARVEEGLSQLARPQVSSDGNPIGRLMMACVNFYKDLLMLENYAIMNYCGFSKILKKHDKITRHKTRDVFMKTIVNNQAFTHYKEVIEMLQMVENIFQRIKALQRTENQNPEITGELQMHDIMSSASEEQQRQIESFRVIKTDAARYHHEYKVGYEAKETLQGELSYTGMLTDFQQEVPKRKRSFVETESLKELQAKRSSPCLSVPGLDNVGC